MPEHIIKKGGEAPAPAPSEAEQIRVLFREYGQPILIGLGLAAAFLLGFTAYKSYRQNSALKAAQLLARAGSLEQLQQVVSQYPSTPSAPLALLTVASRQFENGQYELAQYTYSQFEQKYPKHPMKESAALNRAQCLEAIGDLERAKEAYAAFADAHPDHYLTPPARLGVARVLTQMQKLDEARTAYEDFLAAYPESGWTAAAENALEQVNRMKRAVEAGLPVPEFKALEALAPAAGPLPSIPAAAEPAR